MANQAQNCRMSRIVELLLGVKEVQMDGYRYVVVCSKKQARKDTHIREEVVEESGADCSFVSTASCGGTDH
jgi:hypothetical protein